MNKSQSVSVIVPAYNEEKRVHKVLDTLIKCRRVNEVICVNDGSTDDTLSIIKKVKGISVVNLKKNHGKAYAVAHGIKKAQGQIVVFLDADLQGLKDKDVEKLIRPLISGQYDGTVGYPFANHIDRFFLPLSGERAYFKHDLLPHLKQIEKKGYGLELYLNSLYKDKKVKLFPLKGVEHTLKHEKQSFDIAAKMTLIEGVDILSEIIKQNNPMSYMIKSYLYRFYLGKPKSIDYQLNRLIRYIKKQLNKELF